MDYLGKIRMEEEFFMTIYLKTTSDKALRVMMCEKNVLFCVFKR